MLKISRSDIKSVHLQEFPIESRFIKLPIEKYLELLNIELNPAQTAMVNAINNPNYRFVTAAVSRRVGKTLIANIIGQLITLVPNSHVLVMAPNYALSNISFEEQRKLIKKFNLEISKDNAKDRVIELGNGSTIRMGSVSQVDSVVGRSYDLIIFDEAALSRDGQDAFEVALRPTLDKENSKAIFISTPRGQQNWFANYFGYGFSGLPAFSKWASVHADYTINPRASEEDIAEARATMSAAKFAQEYLADFSQFEGQIFRFDREVCVGNFEGKDLVDGDVIMGVDIGYKDPTAALAIYCEYSTGNFYVLDEYQDVQKTTDVYAENIKRLRDTYNAQFIFIDHSAAQTRADFAYNHDISTVAAEKSKLDGIAYIQMIVEQNRLYVDERCTSLLATLDQYRWDDASKNIEKPIHDEFSHMADALRYALYSFKGNFGEL